MKHIKKCMTCGKEFVTRRAKAKFCSTECKKKCPKWQRYHERTCRVCGKQFLGRLQSIYCSYPCSWKKSTFRTEPYIRGGYVYRWDGEQRRSIYQHVEIAERILGRRLKKGEVVHHINGNKTDNRNCNLLICTYSYHKWLHNEMSRRYAKEHFTH
jgi:hypothetical protein